MTAKRAGGLRLSAFTAIALDIVAAVRHLEAAAVVGDRNPSEWHIDGVEMPDKKTLRITLKPERESGVEAAGSYSGGLRRMLNGSSPPRDFYGPVLARTHDALKYLDDGVANFVVTAPKTKPLRTTSKLAEKIRLLVSDAYREHTALDGTLTGIMWDENRPQFFLTDALTGHRTRCKFDVTLLESVKKALPKRVEVWGVARCNALGEPVQIDVERFEVIPSDEELPQPEDLVDIDICGGMNPTEFVRKLRHGE